MTQEEKQILLNDLKCRLYTKTQCQCMWSNTAKNGSVGAVNELNTYILDELERIDNPDNKDVISDIEPMFSDIKPFLRPMSSMNGEEKNEFINYAGYEVEESVNGRHYEYYLKDFVGTKEEPIVNVDAINWLNTHHFDYRGLIEKGLALEAPEGMYDNPKLIKGE